MSPPVEFEYAVDEERLPAIPRAELDRVLAEAEAIAAEGTHVTTALSRERAGGTAPVATTRPTRAASQVAAQWATRWTVATDRGTESLDLTLVQQPSDSEWGLVWQGRIRELTIRLLMFHGGVPQGEVGVRWTLAPARGGAVTDRLQTVAFVDALHGSGSVLIEDLSGRVESHRIRWDPTPPDTEIAFAHHFFADIALVEQWIGKPIALPSEATPQEVRTIAQTAAMIRSRQAPIRWTRMTLAIDASVDLLEPRPIWVEHPLTETILGRSIDIGIVAGEFVVRQIGSSGNRLVVAPADPRASHAECEFMPPLSDGEDATAFALDRVATSADPDELREWLADHLGADLATYIARADLESPGNDVLMVVRRAFESAAVITERFGDDVARAWFLAANQGFDRRAPATVLRETRDASTRNFVAQLARDFAGAG